MSRFKTNTKAISKLALTLLLLLSAIIGGLLAYTWTIGYFVVLYSSPPEGTLIQIKDAYFPLENATYFEVTLFNPSTSNENATITRIAITTKGSSVLEEVYSINPRLPYVLPVGKERTFACTKYWGDYAGEEIGIVVFINEGAGSTLYKKTDYVKLHATASFDSTKSIEWFTVTVKNDPESKISLNITRIYIDIVEIPHANITPSLATLEALQPNQEVTFNCTYNWEGLMGFDHTLKVGTAQGYKTECSTGQLPSHLELTILGVDFSKTDHFNLTIQNGPNSPHYVNITRIEVFSEQGVLLWQSQLQQSVDANTTTEVMCTVHWWQWTFITEKIRIVAYTLQGFKIPAYEYQLPK